MGVLHETGHAMYERARPKAWRYQPVGEARGMALHESQSLIIEMQACRSREFFQWAAPMLRAAFDGSGPGWDAHNLDRKSVVSGKRVAVRIYLGGRCTIKKKNQTTP